MTLRPWRRDAPLFLRIFVWMLGGVAAVQLFSIAFLILLPGPELHVFTLDQVAAALGEGPMVSELRLSDTEPEAVREPESPRSRQLRRRLATRLGVTEMRVVLRREAPPGFPLMRPPRQGGPLRLAPGARDARDELLFGDFVASLQRDDGGWRTVRPARSGSVEFWRWRALLWLLAATLAMAPIAWILSRRLALPIALFARAAERLGRDPRAEPLALEGPPEIAEAAAAFNEMQARLSRYVDDRAMLTAAIAHDLRTPLMRLSLRLEAAPEPLRTATEGDIRDMEAMIAAVLGFLRDLSSPLRRHPLDLRSLAESVTDGFADRGDPVVLIAGDPVVVDGDTQALKALISNLVGNAVAYGGNAEVEIGSDDHEAWIIVCDRGPGIPPETLERVFQPFFRLEQSRNRATGGVGLGLASARAVARAHGGDIVLANRSGGGLVARVTLPV